MEEFKWKIISQTATDAEGNYTMTWRDQDSNIRVTKHNIFPKENYKGDALDAMDYAEEDNVAKKIYDKNLREREHLEKDEDMRDYGILGEYLGESYEEMMARVEREDKN